VNALLALDPSERPASAAEAGTRFRAWLAQAHPEGVAAALGQRAERARTRGARPSDRPPAPIATDGAAALHGGAAMPGRTPRVTRSIATSSSFVEIMTAGTERLPRAALAERQARGARAPLAGAALLALLALGLLFALRTRPRPAPAAVAPGTRSASAPVETHPEPAPPAVLANTSAPSAVTTPATTAAEAQPPHEPASAAPRAHVSVNALPWAALRVDGRALGTTPKRALALAPGAHVLQLDCPPLGRSARVPLKLAAGADQQILVDLQTEPPKITVR
jgi:hypothetical protein